MLRPDRRQPRDSAGDWEKALGCVVLAGVLDGLDGRIARLLRAQSKFGAELDSLSDNIAFGTAPALILFLWSLQDCAAVRLDWPRSRLRFAARFVWRGSTRGSTPPSSRTSPPASTPAFRRPPGRGSPSSRSILWLITGDERCSATGNGVMAWTLFIAALMISSLPTYSWSRIRIRRDWRLFALAGVALFGAALIVAPG